MGNRAVITTKEKKVGIYLHWNGGRDSVEGFLEFCKRANFRPPSKDPYGWARLAQVIANFMGPDGLSVGLDAYDNLDIDNGDNGVYIIEDWKIVGREYGPEQEQMEYEIEKLVTEIAKRQPKYEEGE